MNTTVSGFTMNIHKALKVKTSSGHAIALWKKRCGIDQKSLII